MTNKIKVIAEYDGWVVKGNTATRYDDLGDFIKGDHGAFEPDGMCYTYLTSLDALHPVAMKVLEELRVIEAELSKEYETQPRDENGLIHSSIKVSRKIDDCFNCIRPILLSCQLTPINGQYIDLFNAVYDGIVYLQNQSK